MIDWTAKYHMSSWGKQHIQYSLGWTFSDIDTEAVCFTAMEQGSWSQVRRQNKWRVIAQHEKAWNPPQSSEEQNVESTNWARKTVEKTTQG